MARDATGRQQEEGRVDSELFGVHLDVNLNGQELEGHGSQSTNELWSRRRGEGLEPRTMERVSERERRTGHVGCLWVE